MNSSMPHSTEDKFTLRFHEERMRQELKDRARRNMRTMNAELLFLIDQGIKATDRVQNAGH